jgi:hypothetical protein
MKKKRSSQSGFFSPRVLIGFVLGSVGFFLALVGLGMSSKASPVAQAPNGNQDRGGAAPAIASIAPGVKIAPEVLADTADG